MSETQPRFIPIPPSQLGGAIAVNIFALLSALALASVLLRAAWLATRLIWFNTSPTQAQEVVFFHTQLGNYASCLVIGMMFNAISGTIGFQWLVQRSVIEGWTCRIQAIFMQMGNFSTGYFTIAIAVHTFNSLVLQMRQSVIICRTTIAIGWISTIIVAFAPFFFHLPEGYVYGAGVMTCGVRDVYPKLQFFFHLLPILLASFLAALLYSLIFLVLRGSLKIKSGVKLTLDPNARWHSSEGVGESYHRFIARVARSMLWYPVAYIAFLIPYAVTRLFVISGFTVSFQVVVFASVCWYSLSVVDVFLLYNTFRVLGPAFDACSAVSTRKSMSMSGDLEKYAPSAMLGTNSDIKEKVHQYRSQSITPLQSSDNARPDSASSYSSRHLLPLYLNHKAPFDRNSEFSVESALGRAILTSNNRQWEVVLPPPTATSPHYLNRQLSSHSRDESSSSLGLPAPPRQSRSTLLTLPEPPRSAGRRDEIETERWLNHQRSTQTFGHQYSSRSRSSSIYSEEGMFSPQSSQWSPRSTRQSLHRKTSEQLAPSSVPSNFPIGLASSTPSQVPAPLERSLSAFSAATRLLPTTGIRPLVLAHAPRSSSVDSKPGASSTTGYF